MEIVGIKQLIVVEVGEDRWINKFRRFEKSDCGVVGFATLKAYQSPTVNTWRGKRGVEAKRPMASFFTILQIQNRIEGPASSPESLGRFNAVRIGALGTLPTSTIHGVSRPQRQCVSGGQ